MGAVFALFAGFYYWTPKIIGRNINDFLGKLHFWTFFVGVNLTFFPQHFLGMAGIYLIISDYVVINSLMNNEILLSLIAIKPYGPHIFPVYFTLAPLAQLAQLAHRPVRIYKPNLDRNLIAVENRNRTVIYQ